MNNDTYEEIDLLSDEEMAKLRACVLSIESSKRFLWNWLAIVAFMFTVPIGILAVRVGMAIWTWQP